MITNCRIEQSGITDHLRKGAHHNQSFEQKLGNLRMVLIDQVVGEIIVNNVYVLCELEKIGLIGYKHIKSLITTMIIFLIGAVLTDPKQIIVSIVHIFLILFIVIIHTLSVF